jgi:hypothetical protein
MKRLTLIIGILTGFCLLSFSQDVVFIKRKLDYTKDKEKFYAFKNDTAIKHGEYKRWNILNDLVETGYYKMGIKDSVWKTYLGGKMVSSVGIYIDGKKNGLWMYYDNIPRSNWKPQDLKSGHYLNDIPIGIWSFYKDGILEQKYDHTNDSLIYYKNQEKEELVYWVEINGIKDSVMIERPPMLIGKSSAEIDNKKHYFDYEKFMDIYENGNTEIEFCFWIETDGSTSDYKIIKSINSGFDQYMIDLYKEKYKWIPAQYKGTLVKCKKTIKERFRITYE